MLDNTEFPTPDNMLDLDAYGELDDLVAEANLHHADTPTLGHTPRI